MILAKSFLAESEFGRRPHAKHVMYHIEHEYFLVMKVPEAPLFKYARDAARMV